jgi:NAD(P)-dependent dehydrogenase (short-subunit alcohol dehydrogenase family)
MISDKQPVALVTGASSGFGKLTTEALLRRGFCVFGTSRSGAGGADGVTMLRLDVDSPESVRACACALAARTGRIDVLINNAGRALIGACEETSAEEARDLFETNFFGVMRVTSAFLPGMRAQGSGAIVNVGSVSGYFGTPFHGIYAASKHALAGYTEALSFEARRFGIRVALVEPDAHRTHIQMARPKHTIACYDSDRDRVEAIIRKQIDNGEDPERVVAAIVSAALGSQTRLRHRIGSTARLVSLAQRFLPEALLARIVRREFQLSA